VVPPSAIQACSCAKSVALHLDRTPGSRKLALADRRPVRIQGPSKLEKAFERCWFKPSGNATQDKIEALSFDKDGATKGGGWVKIKNRGYLPLFWPWDGQAAR
jgi:hypothetical protein